MRRIDEHLQTLIPRMQELEATRLLPGQKITVGDLEDGLLAVDVEGVTVQVARTVAAEVYVSV